jgi:hypothetical protein
MRALPLLTALTLSTGLGACFMDMGGKRPAATQQASAAPAADPAQAEAAQLGREIFEVVDKVMAYRASHFGQLPPNLPALGVDSLTPTTIRRLTDEATFPRITVVFRRTDGRTIRYCSGTNKVLEDSMLNSGPFTIACLLVSGETKDFTVGG